MSLQVKKFVVGPLQENSYLLYRERGGAAVFVDPGDEAERLWQALQEEQLRLTAILLTHAHLDHVGALGPLRERSGAPVYLHSADDALLAEAHLHWAAFGRTIAPLAPAEQALADGQRLDLGIVRLEVIATPGHTPGGVCFWAEPEGLLLAGDTLFRQGIGRTDLPGGDTATLLRSIRQRLFTLPNQAQIAVYPGHGAATILDDERRHNPFVGQRDLLA